MYRSRERQVNVEDLDVIKRLVALVGLDLFDGKSDVLAARDAAEDGVLPIKPRRLDARDEELRSIRIRPRIRHAHGEGAIVAKRFVDLILKLAAPDRLPSRPIPERVAHLQHELRDDAVDDCPFIVRVS